MFSRYIRNVPAMSPKECDSLFDKRVCIIGCGGIGGHIAELLARTGIRYITVVDYDVFSEDNLNRQLFSTEHNLGTMKAIAARDRIQAINSAVTVQPVPEALTEENAVSILKGHDVAVDALDNISSRLILAKHCQQLSIPLVHGAVDGWCGQVTSILPGDDTLKLIYQNTSDSEADYGCLACTVALTASLQCAQVIKLLTGRGNVLSKLLFQFDLLNDCCDLIDFN